MVTQTVVAVCSQMAYRAFTAVLLLKVLSYKFQHSLLAVHLPIPSWQFPRGITGEAGLEKGFEGAHGNDCTDYQRCHGRKHDGACGRRGQMGKGRWCGRLSRRANMLRYKS